jgi:hypothetical protein
VRDAFASAAPLDGFPLSVALGSATAGNGLTVAEAQRLADSRLYDEKSLSRRRRTSELSVMRPSVARPRLPAADSL